MSVVTLVGNPRSGSRTHEAAVRAAGTLAGRIGHDGPGEVVDLSALAPLLLAPGASAGVEVALEQVAEAQVLVVASPVYKGGYTGLLKAFLDRLPGGALAGTVALPLLVMGDARHSLAVEVHLRPLLVELGAAVPTPGLALLESQLADLDAHLGPWADRVAPQTAALLAERSVAR
ncbi:NADPH-dependent FMN reductase [Planomonospora parontospora]|uniref:NADPH-dependent FMN reductase n=1 Tax=Planomonospora parontospora TaxID=58119 RepID=UPI001670E39F|nr:NAD(P)H-dependent oxidoreductase [Planomonospora parontospora]GGL34567.1 FMN reductase [Planomonospora parontospora subsp. antibiotica]GII17189.1 FMN reductase [Planomonospora parontospora subsp. antibiotica]